MILLGLETSCDETACAIVTDAAPGDGTGRARLLANLVHSQITDHAAYGGVVPEIAARAHLAELDGLIRAALTQAQLTLDDLDGVAATAGPGLIGGLLVGLTEAKALAWGRDLPFLAINHLEAHALTARLTHDLNFPYLLLLMSGGHCQILLVEGVGHYTRIGTTIDDAVGEAFDKTAKLMGLPYPGGPAMERAAQQGDGRRFSLPRPMLGAPHADFSFSGLKTALRQHWQILTQDADKDQARADLAASFHSAVADVLRDRLARALETPRLQTVKPSHLVAAGGVASNGYLRQALEAFCLDAQMSLTLPPANLCTDNAAMVAWAGLERLRLGLRDNLSFAARPRWPLDPSAEAKPFAGVKA